MEITAADASPRFDMSFCFDKPKKANNDVVFALLPLGEGTEASWELPGTYVFVHTTRGVIFDFDKMVGGEFEKGLAKLKSQSETR